MSSAEFEVVRQIKESACMVVFNPVDQEHKATVPKCNYTLPDGNVIELGAETFRAPEILFQPDLIGSESRGKPFYDWVCHSYSCLLLICFVGFLCVACIFIDSLMCVLCHQAFMTAWLALL